MIVCFESANAAPARIIKVYAHEDRVFLRILDCHTVVQFDKHIRGPGHHRFQLRFAQFAVKTLGDIESNDLLRRAVRRYAPLSFPPWPASTTTVLKVLLVFLTPVVVTVLQAANEAKKAIARRRVTWRSILIL